MSFRRRWRIIVVSAWLRQRFKLAAQAQAFTVDSEGSPVFTIKLLDDEYLLLGDDRIVSKDSRQVGTFQKEQIQGEVKFRFWPLLPFKTY